MIYKFLIIAHPKYPVLVVNTLVNRDINLLSTLLKIINEVVVELASFDHISIPTLADLLIEYLLLPFVMIWLSGVNLDELAALFQGLLQVLQVFRVPYVLHDILLEVSHLGLQAREEVSNHPADLLLHEFRVCRLHLSHAGAVLLILLGKASLKLLNNEGSKLETLDLPLKDTLVAIELFALIIISHQGLMIDRVQLGLWELMLLDHHLRLLNHTLLLLLGH